MRGLAGGKITTCGPDQGPGLQMFPAVSVALHLQQTNTKYEQPLTCTGSYSNTASYAMFCFMVLLLL